jgi:hypothetical protein
MDECLTCNCTIKTKPCPHHCQLSCNCEEDEQSEEVTGIIDPSGYVYEAVPSNRVEGAVATVYSKLSETDTAVLWNAGAYSQANPLLTDAAGQYAWDVPEGLWQVKYEKPGYETSYSEWLPVPPPQLEINVGIVSKTPPIVTGAYAFEDGADVVFSKYMKPETVRAAFTVALENGMPVDGDVMPVDLENGLASVFRFVPSASFENDQKLKIKVTKQAESYADIPQEEDFNADLTVRIRTQRIQVDDVEIVFGEDGKLTANIFPATSAKHVSIQSNTPSIAVAPAEADVDENGQISVPIVANLPGMAFFTLLVDGTELQVRVGADIVMPSVENPGDSHHPPDPVLPDPPIVDPGLPNSPTPDIEVPDTHIPNVNTTAPNTPASSGNASRTDNLGSENGDHDGRVLEEELGQVIDRSVDPPVGFNIVEKPTPLSGGAERNSMGAMWLFFGCAGAILIAAALFLFIRQRRMQ